MQMVHIEDKMIEKDGKIDWNRARKAKHGVAILSILFYIDNSKPQVTFCDQFSNILLFYLITKVYITHFKFSFLYYLFQNQEPLSVSYYQIS